MTAWRQEALEMYSCVHKDPEKGTASEEETAHHFPPYTVEELYTMSLTSMSQTSHCAIRATTLCILHTTCEQLFMCVEEFVGCCQF